MNIEVVPVRSLGGQYPATTLYPNHAVVTYAGGNSPVVVVSDDEDNKYVLGYLTKTSSGEVRKHIPKPMYSVYGTTENDLYNNIDDVNDLGIISKKKRDVTKGTTLYVGDNFASGTGTDYGFVDNEFWTDINNSEKSVSPVAPASTSEAFTVIADGGGKLYLSTSGTIQEAEAVRINIGTRTTQIVSHDTWTPSTLKATTIEDAITNIFGALSSKYAKGTGLLTANAYEVYNIQDDTLLQLASGTGMLATYGGDAGTKFSKVYTKSDGVHIDVDATRKIFLDVGGSTTLVIENNLVTITATEFSYDGNVTITGTLDVNGAAQFDAALNVDGALTSTGTADLT